MYQSDSVPVGNAPKQRASSPAGRQPPREELLERIEKRKHSFVETAGKRYRLYLGRALTSAGAAIGAADPEHLRVAVEAFQGLVAQRMDRHYIGRLSGVMQAVIAEASQDPDLGFLPGPKAETIAMGFLETLGNAFAVHASRAVGELTPQPTEGMHGCALSFRDDMVPRVRRLNMDMVELYCRAYQEESLAACRENGDECPDAVPQLLDAFGRGLLLPVERYCGIESCAMDNTECFPRGLCAPVLRAMRFYVIGSEKYDVTNRKLLQSIYKYCTTDSTFERARLAEYFEESHVLQYLTAYLVHILHVLGEETKLETFAKFVRTNLKELHPDAGHVFRPAHLTMLLESWARYCLDNLHALNGPRRAARIIQAHLPGAVVRLPEAG